MAFDSWNLEELANALRAEGFDARQDVFRGQVGLLLAERHATIPPADFFPPWELNQNLDAVVHRDFAGIKSQRPPDWAPVLGEKKS